MSRIARSPGGDKIAAVEGLDDLPWQERSPLAAPISSPMGAGNLNDRCGGNHVLAKRGKGIAYALAGAPPAARMAYKLEYADAPATDDNVFSNPPRIK